MRSATRWFPWSRSCAGFAGLCSNPQTVPPGAAPEFADLGLGGAAVSRRGLSRASQTIALVRLGCFSVSLPLPKHGTYSVRVDETEPPVPGPCPPSKTRTERGSNPSPTKICPQEGDEDSASSAKSHNGKVSAARTARSGRMMPVRVSGRPISGQAQTSVSSPSTGSGVSQ
jgi:hypothetical protein